MKRQARIVLAIALVVLLGSAVIITIALRSVGVIADLVFVRGSVERQSASVSWSSASLNDRFRLGDAVRTSEQSTARVRMRGGGGLELRPLTTVRFAASRPGSNTPSLRIERGEVQLQADQAVAVSTQRGVLRVERGGRVQLTVDQGALRVRVDLGRAVVERDGLAPETLGVGASLALENVAATEPPRDSGVPPARRAITDSGVARDSASDVTDDANGDADLADSEPTTDASDANTTDVSDVGDASEPANNGAGDPDPRRSNTAGAVDATGNGATASVGPADLTIRAGESAALHAPALPVIVRLSLAASCNNPRVSFVGRGATREISASQGFAQTALPAGRHSYRVRCDGSRAVVRGSLSVDTATGAAPLPSRPAQSDIELDGHQYSVHYQNLLPTLRVTWPSAPASAGGYVLTVRDARGRSSTTASRTPSVTLTSQVSDGTLRLSMQARSGGARSPEASVVVLFDNAANTAQIREPRPGATLGATVHVEGTALSGSTVTAGSTALSLDSQRRFVGDVARGEQALVIAIRHRSGGTHYYVRRASP
ncbi:MAG: hypothetical protein JNK05_23760 [Myxococcales bacterium]|nr:hypothetical protein [Myxococcales bacterium]